MPSSIFGNTIHNQNPPLQQTPTVDPRLQAISQLYKSGGNPRQMMQSIISAKNPQLAQVINYVNSMGGDPRKAFYELAAQKGVDPETVLSMFKRS